MLNITSDKDVITALSMQRSEGYDVELLGCKFNHVVFQKAGVKTYDDALGFIRHVRNEIKQSDLRGDAHGNAACARLRNKFSVKV